MVNCFRCVVKQTFGWHRTQIFPDGYLGFSNFLQDVNPTLLVKTVGWVGSNPQPTPNSEILREQELSGLLYGLSD